VTTKGKSPPPAHSTRSHTDLSDKPISALSQLTADTKAKSAKTTKKTSSNTDVTAKKTTAKKKPAEPTVEAPKPDSTVIQHVSKVIDEVTERVPLPTVLTSKPSTSDLYSANGRHKISAKDDRTHSEDVPLPATDVPPTPADVSPPKQDVPQPNEDVSLPYKDATTVHKSPKPFVHTRKTSKPLLQTSLHTWKTSPTHQQISQNSSSLMMTTFIQRTTPTKIIGTITTSSKMKMPTRYNRQMRVTTMNKMTRTSRTSTKRSLSPLSLHLHRKNIRRRSIHKQVISSSKTSNRHLMTICYRQYTVYDVGTAYYVKFEPYPFATLAGWKTHLPVPVNTSTKSLTISPVHKSGIR
jgi:hypothetical protein